VVRQNFYFCVDNWTKALFFLRDCLIDYFVKISETHLFNDDWIECLRFELNTCVSDVENFIGSLVIQNHSRKSLSLLDEHQDKIFVNMGEEHSNDDRSFVDMPETDSTDGIPSPMANQSILIKLDNSFSVDIWIDELPDVEPVRSRILVVFQTRIQATLSAEQQPIKIFHNFASQPLIGQQPIRIRSILQFNLKILSMTESI